MNEVPKRQPKTADPLLVDESAWFYLLEPQGLAPRLAEVSRSGRALGGIVVSYHHARDSWSRVGWYAARQNIPADLDTELWAEDMVDRLALYAAEVPEGEGHRAQRLIAAARAAATPVSQTTLAIDGRTYPALTASVYDDQITFAIVASRKVFVQTRRWDGPLDLRTSTERPDLSSRTKR
jgi:hypothetical protein